MSIGVIGAGSWGVALAQLYAAQGQRVVLWARRVEAAEEIMRDRRSSYLPDMPLDAGIEASSDPAILSEAQTLLCVVPVQATRETVAMLSPHLREAATLVICSKGLEQKTLALPTQIAAAVLPNPCAVLSGPSFAG